MIHLTRLFAISLFALLSFGCAGIDGGPLVNPGDATGRLIINNRSSVTLTVVTLSRCSNFTHGFNRLPENTVIRPGGQYGFTLSTGCWDIQVGRGDVTSTHTSTHTASLKMDITAGRVHVFHVD